MFLTNVDGTFLLSRLAARRMIEQEMAEASSTFVDWKQTRAAQYGCVCRLEGCHQRAELLDGARARSA